MPGHVLDAAGHPGARQPVEHRACQRRDLHRLAAERAVADHVVRARLAYVEQRGVIDRDPDFGEIVPERFGIGPRRLDRARRRHLPQPGERLAGRERFPFGRLHPRDPPAFLVDRHQQPLAPVDRAQLVGQRAQLRAVLDVAPEQDVAGRVGFAEESALVVGQRRTGQAEDRGRHGEKTRRKAKGGQVCPGLAVWTVTTAARSGVFVGSASRMPPDLPIPPNFLILKHNRISKNRSRLKFAQLWPSA